MDDMEQLARGMVAALDEDARLGLAVEAAVELIPGCDHAGVTVIDGRALVTPVATDAVVEQGDRLQYDLGEGPCIDSVRDHLTVVSHDLGEEGRWPRWAPRANAELGVHSMLSLLLYVDERSYGALNLYGDRRRAFAADDLATATAIAGHLAVAMAASREIDHLGVAINNRTVIGQAEGILMERLGIDAETAFTYLSRVSQQTNRKLVLVATQIVTTRKLPTAP